LPVDLLYTGRIPFDGLNAAFDELAGGEVVRQVVTFEREPAGATA
jgi:Zn-dependent alcohol dehydrogenase